MSGTRPTGLRPGVTIMCDRRQVFGADGRLIRLSAAMYELLLVLAEADGRTVSRADITDRLQRNMQPPAERHIDRVVHELRRRLPPDLMGRRLIQTVHSEGYFVRPGVVQLYGQSSC